METLTRHFTSSLGQVNRKSQSRAPGWQETLVSMVTSSRAGS